MKKWWVKLLVVFVVVLLAISTWFFNAGTDSKTRLEQYRKQLLAAGAGFIDDAFRYMTRPGMSLVNTNPPAAMCMVAPGKAKAAWWQNEIVSLRGNFFKTNTWEDLESDLTGQSQAFDLLQQAATRPEFDFGLDFRQAYLPVPNVQELRQAVNLLAAKIVLDLHHGDTASAATNFQTLLVIANAGKNEPAIGSQNMRAYFMQSVFAVQWELLQATNITDEQLAAFQSGWTNVDFIKPMEKAELMTRAIIGLTMKEGRAGRPLGGSGGPPPGMSGPLDFGGLVQMVRRGIGDTLWRESWAYDDELTLLQGYGVMAQTMRQVESNGYFKDAFAERDNKIAAFGLNRTNVNQMRKRFDSQHAEIGVEFIHFVEANIDRVLFNEARRQCAITAIALKRYQLRHGTLPKELSALVPEFLPAIPRDPVDAKPIRFQLNADGTFLLYSIGKDGLDDGGDATPVPPASLLESQSAPDWVWPQPATQVEIQNYYDHPPK